MLAESVPRRADVTAPGVGTIALLTSEVGTGEDEDALAVIHGTLAVIHTTHRHQWEGVANTTIRTHCRRLVTLFLGQVHLVGVSGVHPPSVNTHLVQTREVVPIDVTSLLAIDVVATHAAGVVSAWRPLRESALRPSVEVEHETLGLHFLERLGLRTERCPDADAHVGVLLVHLVDHILSAVKVGVEELHRVPVVVAAPVLPVLNDTVERNLQVTIFVHHLEQFLLRLVTLAALMETISPEGQHGHFAREVAHLGNHTVGIATIHEVVIHHLAHFRLQFDVACLTFSGSDQTGGGVVVPVDAITLDGLVEMGKVLQIALFHTAVLTPLAHLAVLQESYTVDTLVAVHRESLLHLVGIRVRTFGDGRESTIALTSEEVTFVVGKRHFAILHRHRQCR